MRDITLSVDDQIYQKAEIKAAQLGTSVPELLKAALIWLVEDEADSERRKRLQYETLASIHAFSAGDRLNRSDAHERSTLPGNCFA